MATPRKKPPNTAKKKTVQKQGELDNNLEKVATKEEIQETEEIDECLLKIRGKAKLTVNVIFEDDLVNDESPPVNNSDEHKIEESPPEVPDEEDTKDSELVDELEVSEHITEDEIAENLGDTSEDVNKSSDEIVEQEFLDKNSTDDEKNVTETEKEENEVTENINSTDEKDKSSDESVDEKEVSVKILKGKTGIRLLVEFNDLEVESDNEKSKEDYMQLGVQSTERFYLGSGITENETLMNKFVAKKCIENDNRVFKEIIPKKSLIKRGARIVNENKTNTLVKKEYRKQRKQDELNKLVEYNKSEVAVEEERLNHLYMVWVNILTVVLTATFIFVLFGAINGYRLEKLNNAQSKYDNLVARVESMHYPFCTNPIKEYSSNVALCRDNVYRFNTMLDEYNLRELKGSSTKIKSASQLKTLLDKFDSISDKQKAIILGEYNTDFFKDNVVACLVIDEDIYDIGYISSIEINNNAEVIISETVGSVYKNPISNENQVGVYLLSFSSNKVVPKDFHIKYDTYDDDIKDEIKKYAQQIEVLSINSDKIKDAFAATSEGEDR